MTAAVVGLGKIGLPLAVQIAGAGTPVIGLDIDERVVATVLDGGAPFPGEPHLDTHLRATIADGSFTATTDPAVAVPGADVVIVVVPLMVGADKTADFRVLDAATEAVAPHLSPGTLVSYETTLPVGATRGRFTPRLAALSGLELGVTLFVCHSPERVSSGRVFADLARYPKLVGGVDAASEARAVDFYRSVLTFDERADLAKPNGVWALGTAEAAELAKLAETTYRDVNIAFANELALAAERVGLDIAPIIEACNSQPYSHIHTPGISVGGHCIPVYPHLLMESVPGFRVPATARQVNDAMPPHAVAVVEAALGGLDGRTVAVLGLAYRGGVKEDAFSGAHPTVAELVARRARPLVHDPMYGDGELLAMGFTPYELGTACDAAILHTDHDDYRHLRREDLPGAVVLFDGRRSLDRANFPGVRVIRIGDGTAGANEL